MDAVVGERGAKLNTMAHAAKIQSKHSQLDIHYDQRAGTVNFGESRIATPATSLNLSGTLGQTLDVRARSTNLDDLLPALGMFSDSAPSTLPVKLDPRKQGEAAAVGLVSGRLDAPQFQGQVTVTNASVEGHAFDRFTADVQASPQAVALRRLTLTRAQTQVTGDAVVGANAGNFLDGPLTAQLSVKNLPLAAAAREFGDRHGSQCGCRCLGVGHRPSSGTARRPEAEIALDAAQAGFMAKSSSGSGRTSTIVASRLPSRRARPIWERGSCCFPVLTRTRRAICTTATCARKLPPRESPPRASRHCIGSSPAPKLVSTAKPRLRSA